MTALILCCLVAFAQEPEPEQPVGPPPGWVELTPVDGPEQGAVSYTELEDEVDYEVVVWGEHAIRQARAEVVRAMEDQGWEKVKENGDAYVFKGPEPWMGRARLYRDGRFDFSRPVVVPTGVTTMPSPGHIQDPNPRLPSGALEYGADIDREIPPTSHAGSVHASGAAGVSFQAPGKRKVEAVQARALHGVRPQLTHYRAVIRETAFQDALNELPQRLDLLWTQGVPLEGETTLGTPAERRAVALELWATRADTPEGDGVRRAVALWLRETVMDSEHPMTAEEKAWAEDKAGRKLDLSE